MAITAKETKQRELTPAGSHVARCYKMIHFGHIPEMYMGELKIQNKMRIDFELPHEMRMFDEKEQPLSMSKDYTVSLSESSNLRKDLESWRGKVFTQDELSGFDVTAVIGASCMINVIHKVSKTSGKQYAIIASISPIPKGTECPDAINPTFIWDYEENFDEGILENLHDWFKNQIKSSEEYKDKVSIGDPDIQDAPMPELNDEPNDLPF